MCEQRDEELRVSDWANELHINEYYKDDKENRDVILFVFLWMKFNGYYNKNSDCSIELARVLEASKDTKMDSIYKKKQDEYLDKFKRIPQDGSNEEDREKVRNFYKNTDEYYNSGKNSLDDFLKVVYTIRCNFFHGNKVPDYNNKKLITWAYNCLQEILEGTC